MGGLLLALLVGYIIGGLSFVPLLVWILWTWNTRRQSDTQAHTTPGLPDRESNANPGDWGAALGEDLLRELKAKHVPDVASGYFAICREYVPGGVNGKPPDRNTPSTGAMSTMESPSVYQSMYRSIFDRSRNTGPTLNPSASQAKNKKPRNVFYVVLRFVLPFTFVYNTHGRYGPVYYQAYSTVRSPRYAIERQKYEEQALIYCTYRAIDVYSSHPRA